MTEWAIVALISAIAPLIGVYLLAPKSQQNECESGNWAMHARVLLFDGPDLIDMSSAARAYFKGDLVAFDWIRLRDALIDHFPTFPDSPTEVREQGNLAISSGEQRNVGVVVCEWIDGIIRVEIRDPKIQTSMSAENLQELETLQKAMGQAPYPVWHVDLNYRLKWSNSAYQNLREMVGVDKTNQTEPMFPSVCDKGKTGKKTRASVALAGGEKRVWFDVSVLYQDDGYLCYAVDINAVVDAEIAQRNFVQTLAKTFAQLSIGLAIFDRNRQLALFNPALIDLTALPADFLSARPNLLSFFDRLRDQRMMPEPKNYGSWRHQMADLVAAAADGRYQETWTLPSGAVYSVSGRPHPDGAVAFLFEDITAEITLTRRFRTDLEIGQSMLDQLDDAIAVFSENGALCSSNIAYRRLWNVDPEGSFVQMTILDAVRSWQGMCRANPILGEVRDFVEMRENRAEWGGEITLKTGQTLTCGVFPICHGATMVVFGPPTTTQIAQSTTQRELSSSG